MGYRTDLSVCGIEAKNGNVKEKECEAHQAYPAAYFTMSSM